METIDEDVTGLQPIPLVGSYNRRFYFPLILLASLRKTFQKSQSLRMPNAENAPPDVLKGFINKLGHICDSRKGGETVTAFAILQQGTIQYCFTSNKRDEEDYQRTTHYITGILNILGEASDDEIVGSNGQLGSLPVFLRLLRSIIEFNQSRIKGYISRISEALDTCIDSVERDQSNEGRTMLRSLERLQPTLRFMENSGGTMQQFVENSLAVIQTISRIHTPLFKEYLRLRTHNNTDRSAPWVALHHSLGRLLSYYYAINILLAARRTYPQLFVDFSITSFPSAPARPVNLPRSKLCANLIINNMTSDPQKRTTYQQYALVLENSGIPLNTTITACAIFKPLVHAEVNLLSHLLRLPDPPAWFLNTRYIGTSKPTCRLCELYFAHHPSGVEVREGHRNLYLPWRTPDVYTQEGARERNRVLDQMVPMVRDEVFLCLSEKFAWRRPNDSWDTPSNVPPEEEGMMQGGLCGGGGISQAEPEWRGLPQFVPSDGVDDRVFTLMKTGSRLMVW
ncbi:hypothetical protein QBC34DRAFT_499728 [Podospora aff. communis PSN243]|uniref:Uncharacterized protein n=1 Tax=Podospora aff. communis PSN243 TaxID=3040156 RepID=A0AAV9G1V8_9PEZI|nr:hypothetical protein QBC34DRAFT_499728 [Podospora aff. communis PSN243]